MIDRDAVKNLDDTEYHRFVSKFCRAIIFSPSFNGKLTSEQLDDAQFLMKNGVRLVEKDLGSHNLVQGAIAKLQLVIVFGYEHVAFVPDWVYRWKEDLRP